MLLLVMIPVNVANVVDIADIDKSYHFKSSESLHYRLIKTKASLSPLLIIGKIVRDEAPE